MGMDLCGSGGALHLSVGSWDKLLDIARQFGWVPAGTVDPQQPPLYEKAPDPEWCGTYDSNDYQTVTAEDAAGLADALEKAIEAGESEDPDYVREFIEYCRAGSFCLG